MKKLIFKLLTLGSLVIALLFISAFLEGNNISDKVSFKSKSVATYAIFGHSHPETAFNDSIISNFENFARSGDSYYYIYPKLKRIIEDNENIKVVFMEYTNNQVSSLMDEWIWGQRYLSSRYRLYEPFIALKDQEVILKNNFSEYVPLFFESRKKNFNRILDKDYFWSDYNKFGGYLYLERDKTDSLLKSSNYKRVKLENSDSISEVNLVYLRKILSFLKEKEIRTYLIRTPQHQLSASLNNESTFIDIFNERFSDIPFLDLNAFPLENSEYGDLEHLNYKGAYRFSLWFDSILKNGLLEAENKQDFINKQIQSYSDEEQNLLAEKFQMEQEIAKQNLPQEIIEQGNKKDVKFTFSSGITTKSITAYSKEGTNYLLLEMETPLNPESLKEMKFGITGIMYKQDSSLRPQWLKERNSFNLSWISDIRLEEIDGKPHILISFQKNVDVEKLEVLTLYLQNDLGYAGKLGSTLRIMDFDL